jgi:hypothetical protein
VRMPTRTRALRSSARTRTGRTRGARTRAARRRLPPLLPPASSAVDEKDFDAEDVKPLLAGACRKDGNSSECAHSMRVRIATGSRGGARACSASASLPALFLPRFPCTNILSHPELTLLTSVDVLSNSSLPHNPPRSGRQ